MAEGLDTFRAQLYVALQQNTSLAQQNDQILDQQDQAHQQWRLKPLDICSTMRCTCWLALKPNCSGRMRHDIVSETGVMNVLIKFSHSVQQGDREGSDRCFPGLGMPKITACFHYRRKTQFVRKFLWGGKWEVWRGVQLPCWKYCRDRGFYGALGPLWAIFLTYEWLGEVEDFSDAEG